MNLSVWALIQWGFVFSGLGIRRIWDSDFFFLLVCAVNTFFIGAQTEDQGFFMVWRLKNLSNQLFVVATECI